MRSAAASCGRNGWWCETAKNANMTVRELYNWCKAQRDKDAEVYVCKDWEQIDEEGNLTDLYRVRDVVMQRRVIDAGLDFEEECEVILDVDENRAVAGNSDW